MRPRGRRRGWAAWALVLGLWAHPAAASAPAGIDALRDWMRAEAARGGRSGVAAAYAPRKGAIWTSGHGTLDADDPVIGEAKLFVDLTMLTILEERGLSLGAALSTLAPEAAPGATIEDLLDHPEASPTLLGPGSAGLTGLVEQLEGAPWGDAVRARVLRPLGLTRSRAVTPAEVLPPTYRLMFGRPWRVQRAAPPGPALMGTTLRELGRVAQELIEGRSIGAATILDHDGDASHLGWRPLDLDGTPALGLDAPSPTGGFSLVLVPRKKLGVVVGTDSTSAWAMGDPPLAEAAAEVVLGQDPAPRADAVETSRRLAAALGALTLVVAGSLLVRARRRAWRPASPAGWGLFVVLRLLELGGAGAVLALTVASPEGLSGWAGLASLQPDAAWGLAGSAALLAGSAVARLVALWRS